MNPNFSRVITLLRKERGISQKSAAQELGISQALLSHYEKGIRECGLAFVVKAADFYGVSCDYLLGRSPERQGITLRADDLEDPSSRKEQPDPRTLQAVYSKKLLFCSLNVLFDLLAKIGSKALLKEASDFLSLAVYRMFRIVFRANPSNKEEMFVVPSVMANQQAQAKMTLCEVHAQVIASAALPKSFPPPAHSERVEVSNAALERNYAADKSALLNLIKNCEQALSDADLPLGKNKQ